MRLLRFNSKMMSSSHDLALISHAQPDIQGTGSESDASDEHDDASEHASSEPEVVEDTVPVSHVYTVLIYSKIRARALPIPSHPGWVGNPLSDLQRPIQRLQRPSYSCRRSRCSYCC